MLKEQHNTEEIEKIICDIKDSLSYIELGFSGGQSVDRIYCPICGADDVIKYNSNQSSFTMDALEHEKSCAYSLIRKLEIQLLEELK